MQQSVFADVVVSEIVRIRGNVFQINVQSMKMTLQ